MKILALFHLALLLQACSQPDLQSKTLYCDLPSPSTDSAQLAGFKEHMERMEVLNPFIPAADTMYCFRGKSGWGDFDYLCSVYNDSAGYKAAFTQMTNLRLRGKNDVTFEENIKPVSSLLWKDIQTEFESQDFWCSSYIIHKGIDGNECYLWGREGKKFRLINWDNVEPELDSLKIIGKHIWDMCNGPTPAGAVDYFIKRDSIHATIYSTNYLNPFSDYLETKMYYDGKLLSQKDGLSKFTLPKKDFNKLKKAEIVEYGIDGSIHRFRVSEIHQEKH